MELPSISIIIVNYNGRAFLPVCLSSLYKMDYPHDKLEVILVDNNSSNGSIEYIKQSSPRVTILQLDKNYGFCKPNNEGGRNGRGEQLVFLNNIWRGLRILFAVGRV